MPLHLYNTLTRRVEPFAPLAPPRVTMYTCGPTVWNYAHIGNFRTFLFEDLLRRYLEYSGYDVFHIMNLTDVDDRTIDTAAKNGRSLREHTQPYVDAFMEDCEYLRIAPAHVYPRATEYIEPMVALVQALLDKELAYEGEDGSVYFDVDRLPTYGKLSQVERRQLKAGARVASDDYDKDDVRDFALWKAAAPVDEEVGAAWDAPFGRGRPGWHLECSAMVLSELEQRFGVRTVDLHAGGVDLIFPHHENEIAQAEGATGETFCRHWVHGEFLTVEGTKMSKRYGNILTPRDLQDNGVAAETARMLLFGTHYRQQLNFTDDALAAAAEGVKRLAEFRRRLGEAAGDAAPSGRGAGEAAEELDTQVRAALDDDLNAPKAIGALFTFVRKVNKILDGGDLDAGAAAALTERFDAIAEVFQLVPVEKAMDGDLGAWADEQVAARNAARAAKDWAEADRIRDDLAAKGIELVDTPDGTRWKQKV